MLEEKIVNILNKAIHKFESLLILLDFIFGIIRNIF